MTASTLTAAAGPLHSQHESRPLPPLAHPLPFTLLPTAPSSWDPAAVSPTLNIRLDGCIVPSEASEQGARIAYSHAVVIDGFVEDCTRGQLLDFLLNGLEADADPQQQQHSPLQLQQQQGSNQQQQQQQQRQASLQPSDSARWEQRTTDMAGGAATWGVKQHVLQELAEGRLPALREVHARLCKLYPECDIAHLPTDAIQLAPSPHVLHSKQEGKEVQHNVKQQQQQQQRQQAEQEVPLPLAKRRKQGSEPPPPATEHCIEGTAAAAAGGCSSRHGPVDCSCFVANAAVAGDSFSYHVDADPTSFPDGSPWNEWRREWGAETLLLDGQTDGGVFVAPRPCRAVLLDQDILHRVSAPSAAAGNRPRFSLVWKLALLPRHPGQQLCLARPEWGPPASIGSAARVDAVKRQMAQEQRRKNQAS
ncbi:hypothetical protein D9Q98_007071 [Chlorella vulgaris]|uniref:Uncharacterized protein n=1 Tax=Chlorella vulgaris TaxID=3077 RepID=A0A9D4TJG4_CHLVU|nr:hypothetical protein D9Q98_007071 [Chlorella vulgaris]